MGWSATAQWGDLGIKCSPPLPPTPPHPHSWTPVWLQVCQKLQVSASLKPEDTLFSRSRGRMALEVHMPEASGPQARLNLEINQPKSSSRGLHGGGGGGGVHGGHDLGTLP